MKVLFVTNLYIEKANGISNKILSQVKGLRDSGADVELCHLLNKDGCRFWAIDGKPIGCIGNSVGIVASKFLNSYYSPVLSYLKRNDFDFVYWRYNLNASFALNSCLSRINKSGAKIIMEIPTYPYDGELALKPFYLRPLAWLERYYRNSFCKYVENIVTFSIDRTILNIPTIYLSNAVDPELIPLRDKLPVHDYVRMTGVANLNFWHGYDRILKGLSEYYKTTPSKEVFFDLVGGGPIAGELKSLAMTLGIEKYVTFHGLLHGEDLTKVLNETDLCIGSLARHRTNIVELKSLKNIEYATRGIPFVYSENNNDFDEQEYVIKVTPDDSPVDMSFLLNEFDRVEKEPKKIRESVAHLSWKTQMAIVYKRMCEVNDRK